MTIEIVDYDEQYRDAVLDLLSSSFHGGFTDQRFEWLHFQNPLAPSRINLAVDNGRVVGFNAVVKKWIQVDGNVTIAGRNIDPVVAPSYRGKGLFSRLLDDALSRFDEIDIFFNFANAQSAPGFIKKGWKQLLIKNLFYMAGFGTILSRQFWLSVISRAYVGTPKANMTVQEIDLHAISIETSCQNEAAIFIIKSEEYISWRYANPDRKYQFYAVYLNDLLVAYVISRMDGKRCLILDAVKVSEVVSDAQVLHCFLVHMSQTRSEMKIVAWNRTVPHLERYMLARPWSSHPAVYVRPARNKHFEIDVLEPTNWYLPMGESEFL